MAHLDRRAAMGGADHVARARAEPAAQRHPAERRRRRDGKHELEAQPLDLNDLTRDTIELVSADAAARQVRVETDLGPTIAPVLGDRVHLQQVLLNLTLNGMEAMSKTPRERRRLVVRTAQSNGMVEVSVRDTGTGIPGGDPARVFEPFFTTRPEGMGMGLSISRSIVEAGPTIATPISAGWRAAWTKPRSAAGSSWT